LNELPKVYFERLLENSPDIVVAVDRKGTVIFYNDGAHATLGYEGSEILGEPVQGLYPTKEEARRVMKAMRGAECGGQGLLRNFETEFLSKDGLSVPVAISGSLIHDAAGREQGSIGFAKDISELKAHEQLATMGQLAVGLAHEINNPLEILVNQVELLERYLKQKAIPEDYSREHERVDAIKRELRRIQSIVERVGEMAADGEYAACEYLPGQLMTDLGSGSRMARLAERAGETPDDAAAVGCSSDLGERSAEVNGSAVSATKNSIRGRNIIVVDDDHQIRASMAEILSDEGCNVVTTPSGFEALNYLKDNDVDLVISDVQMPDMDGYELFRLLKADHADVPVVLMTAYYYDKDHVIKRSKADGLSDVIFKKPIDPARLLELVDARVGTT
jgi:PAS domain S-box-containing protein